MFELQPPGFQEIRAAFLCPLPTLLPNIEGLGMVI
jgi:hypothetical protein